MPKKRLSLVCNDDSYLGRRIKIFKVKKNSPVYDVKRIAADLKARQSSRAKEEFEKTQAERQLKKKKCDIIARMKQKSCAMTAGQGRITNSLPASTVAPPKPKQRKETSVRSPASDNMPSIALDEDSNDVSITCEIIVKAFLTPTTHEYFHIPVDIPCGKSTHVPCTKQSPGSYSVHNVPKKLTDCFVKLEKLRVELTQPNDKEDEPMTDECAIETTTDSSDDISRTPTPSMPRIEAAGSLRKSIGEIVPMITASVKQEPIEEEEYFLTSLFEVDEEPLGDPQLTSPMETRREDLATEATELSIMNTKEDEVTTNKKPRMDMEEQDKLAINEEPNDSALDKRLEEIIGEIFGEAEPVNKPDTINVMPETSTNQKDETNQPKATIPLSECSFDIQVNRTEEFVPPTPPLETVKEEPMKSSEDQATVLPEISQGLPKDANSFIQNTMETFNSPQANVPIYPYPQMTIIPSEIIRNLPRPMLKLRNINDLLDHNPNRPPLCRPLLPADPMGNLESNPNDVQRYPILHNLVGAPLRRATVPVNSEYRQPQYPYNSLQQMQQQMINQNHNILTPRNSPQPPVNQILPMRLNQPTRITVHHRSQNPTPQIPQPMMTTNITNVSPQGGYHPQHPIQPNNPPQYQYSVGFPQQQRVRQGFQQSNMSYGYPAVQQSLYQPNPPPLIVTHQPMTSFSSLDNFYQVNGCF